MTWVSQNADLVKSIRAYVEIFKNEKPLFFQYFSDGRNPVFHFPLKSEEGMKLLLLFSALNQGISERDLSRLIIDLYKHSSTKIFLLNEISFGTLRKLINDFPFSSAWDISLKAPGIIRSVCDFFLARGELSQTINNYSTSEDMVRLLSEEIFFMGKSSVMKFKARMFIWLLNCAYRGEKNILWDRKSILPITPGINRFMHLIGPLKSRKQKKNSLEEKLEYFNRFFRFLFQDKSWIVFTALDVYKKKIISGVYECEKIISGCRHCPICPYCRPHLL